MQVQPAWQREVKITGLQTVIVRLHAWQHEDRKTRVKTKIL